MCGNLRQTNGNSEAAPSRGTRDRLCLATASAVVNFCEELVHQATRLGGVTKYESFMLALNRTDPKNVRSEVASKNLNKCAEIRPELADEKFACFIPFAQVLVKICSLVDLSKDEA